MEKPDLIPRIFKALVNSEKTIDELCEEMNEDVLDVEIGIDHAVDLGILHKIEKIGTAVKLADSTAENNDSATDDDEPGPSDANRRRGRGGAQTRSRSRGKKRAQSRSATRRRSRRRSGPRSRSRSRSRSRASSRRRN